MGNGTVISLGQAIVDLTMSVEKIPQPGQDVFADEAGIHVGASYNTLHAVRQMGVNARHAGILGTGPWADTIRRVFESEGIRHVGPTDESVDSGFCVALTDGTAERTFISMRGAEARGDESTFQSVEPADGDVVHISGYTFAHHTGEGLRAFMRRTAPNRRFLALFDPSPVVADIDDETFGEMVEYRPVWSCNEREDGPHRRTAGIADAPGNVPHADRADGTEIGLRADRPRRQRRRMAGPTGGGGRARRGIPGPRHRHQRRRRLPCRRAVRRTEPGDGASRGGRNRQRGGRHRGDATGSGHMSFQNRSGEAACHANLIVIMTISWVMMCPNGSAKRTRNALPPARALSRKVQGSEGDITENEQG